jgi:predicted nucleotidyltransferase
MRIREGLEIDDDRLADICRRHHVTELLVFGSALRDDFGPESDVDVLVTFEEGAHVPWGGVDFMCELEEALGRKVDMVHKSGLHWYIRDRVLAEARLLHAA